jgi:hypothetical protein
MSVLRNTNATQLGVGPQVHSFEMFFKKVFQVRLALARRPGSARPIFSKVKNHEMGAVFSFTQRRYVKLILCLFTHGISLSVWSSELVAHISTF